MKPQRVPVAAPPLAFALALAATACRAVIAAEPADPPAPDEARILTHDGEVIIGRLALEEIPVRTEYGTLAIPIDEVGRIDVVPGAAGDAGAGLAEDTVSAKRFTIRGRVLVDTFEIAGAYGVLRVERADIDRIYPRGGTYRPVWDKVLIVKSWTDVAGEFQNVLGILKKRTRLRFVEFSGASASDLRKALRGHGVLLVPELEQGGSAATQVAREAAPAIQRFVRDGGVIVCCGGNENARFLCEGGVLPCSGGETGGTAEPRGRHSILRGVKGTIPQADATFPISVESRRMKTLAAAPGGKIIVGVAGLGQGAVVYCGWDFYASEEVHQKILENAVRWAAGQTGREPTGRESTGHESD
ncbi:MAG: hypothetical protein JXP34_18430 [Planctomycetes bacterium]|nr:hypothetical protein [Planctomycetota bacterium]